MTADTADYTIIDSYTTDIACATQSHCVDIAEYLDDLRALRDARAEGGYTPYRGIQTPTDTGE